MQRANNKSLAKSSAPGNPVAQIKSMASDPKYVSRFKEVIGKKAPQFLASVVSAVRGNPMLSNADPTSVMASAMIAATLDLDINPSLGFAAIVPYKKNKKNSDGSWSSTTQAQFQIMTKGFVQLALRSGQYRNINVVEIYEDEYDWEDILSGEIHLNPIPNGDRAHGRVSKIIGYAAYLEFINGFRKIVFWKMERIQQHAQKFSKSWDQKNGRFFKGSAWDTNYEAMCRKTVLKNSLSSWGILSTQMQTALVSDEGIKQNMDTDEIEYPSSEDHEKDNEQEDNSKDNSDKQPINLDDSEDVDSLFQ